MSVQPLRVVMFAGLVLDKQVAVYTQQATACR